MSIHNKKIAIIWSTHTKDPLYSVHHTFWEAALRDRPDCNVDRYTWNDLDQIPKGYDLYFFVDYNHVLFSLDKYDLHPRVFYWWDAFHHPFAHVSQVTHYFDKSYFAEHQTAIYLQNQGFNVKWLPAAFYEKLYRPIEATQLYNTSFVGQLDNIMCRNGTTRKQFVDLVVRDFKPGYFSWNVYGEQVNLIYNQSKILFDRPIFNNVGTRFFEGIGSGKLMLTARLKGNTGLDLLGIDGVHYVSYDDTFVDFKQKFAYFLNNPDKRDVIAKTGHEYFLANHTYAKRIETIFTDFNLHKQA